MKHLLRSGVAAALLIVAVPASAEYPTHDAVAIEQLRKALEAANKQIEQLTEMVSTLQSQLDAVGAAGQITLPVFNMAKIGSQLRQDAQCLLPDLTKLMPSLDFEDISFGSICDRSSVYRQTLWIDPSDKNALPFGEQTDLRAEVNTRRENILVDVTSKALAQGDMAADTAVQLNEAADEYETNVRATQQSNERLNLIAQGQVMTARALAQQNQILATMLKLQAAFIMKAGVPVDSIIAVEEEE
ncbi:hypothetical protein HH303_05545 [Rhodospirillaceae bacterium KN72]|uniref:Type IV secretion system protein n=1 Tax=Pacificispira spongiicola TaxID=2729598 RepID=A0A7Y0HG30_9PROT|nr:hypothetical protein [Pacificispira spongiicola]NMM43929.1 hypothetical protein [Pacificispira spongiicola]